MNNPEIRIQYARLLDPHFKSLFEYKKEAGLIPNEMEYPAPENTISQVELFKAEWETRQDVLTFLQELFLLDFYQPIIDAYVVGRMKGGMSTPLIIGSQISPSVYIDTLTHEIIHRLISDNKQKINLKEILPSMFPNESDLCRVHVIVHAALKKVYLEFAKQPERLTANKDNNKQAPDYMKAWEIVENTGADAIISKFKSYYKK